MKSYVSREIYCSIILGGITSILVLNRTDLATLFVFIKGIVPPDVVLYYFASLTIVTVAVWWMSCYLMQKSASLNQLYRGLHTITNQVGFSLIGLYRMIAGSLLVITPPILITDPSFENCLYAGFSLFFAIACIVVCCALSTWQDLTIKIDHHQKMNVL